MQELAAVGDTHCAHACGCPLLSGLLVADDPEMPFKQEYRQFLMDQVVYREVLPIQDPTVRSKIHQSYRLGYIKVSQWGASLPHDSRPWPLCNHAS